MNSYKNLRDQFDFDNLLELSPPLIGEDYEFKIQNIPALVDKYEILHDEISFVENSSILTRGYYIGEHRKKQTILKFNLVFCWTGFKQALNYLFDFCESFQRPIPISTVFSITKKHKIGAFGLSWSWDNEDIICAVRNNVVFTLKVSEARLGIDTALGIDRGLSELRTTSEYREEEDSSLSSIKKKIEGSSIPAGGSITLGDFPTEDINYFFVTTSGSMNLIPASNNTWYYRAGLEKGNQKLTLFYVGSGILLKKESIKFKII